MSTAPRLKVEKNLSIDALTWAFKIQMPPHAKLLLLELADHKNIITGLCFPSIKTIQHRTGLNRAQIFHYSECLQAAGLISITKGGARQVNHYTLNESVSFREPLRFTRPPRRGSHGYPVTVIEPEDNQNSDTNVSGGTLRIPPLVRKNDIKNAHQGIQQDPQPLTNISTGVDTDARTSTQRPAQAEAIQNGRAAPSPAEREIAAARAHREVERKAGQPVRHGGESDKQFARRQAAFLNSMEPKPPKSAWPTWIEKNHAKRRGVEWTDVVDVIQAEHGLPEPADDLAPWKKRFFAMCAAIAGGFPDRCQAGGYELDELFNDNVEDVA